jgi:hypothetical protein
MKDPYPSLLINWLRHLVIGCEWFTSLDSKDGYYLIRLKNEESENATIMQTHYRDFTYKVITFGLVNATATFQCMMNII